MKKESQQATLDIALARAAHDMRNPLQVISGTAEVMLLQAQDSSQQESLRRILQQTEFMTFVMDDLVSFARPMEIGSRTNTLEEMHAVLVPKITKFAESERVTVQFSTLPDLRLSSLVMHKFSRILLNLINNAIAQSYGGTVQVEICTDDHQVTFKVEDDGAGMEYDPDDSSKRSILAEKGLGIGIICALVAGLDGKVCWVNEPRSVVSVKIPL